MAFPNAGKRKIACLLWGREIISYHIHVLSVDCTRLELDPELRYEASRLAKVDSVQLAQALGVLLLLCVYESGEVEKVENELEIASS